MFQDALSFSVSGNKGWACSLSAEGLKRLFVLLSILVRSDVSVTAFSVDICVLCFIHELLTIRVNVVRYLYLHFCQLNC